MRRGIKKIVGLSLTVILVTYLTSIYFYIIPTKEKSLETIDRIKLTNAQNENAPNKKELSIICSNGRLGNQMFLYAVLYGLATLNNRLPVPPSCITSAMKGVFKYFPKSTVFVPKKKRRGHAIGRYFNETLDSQIPLDKNIITGNPFAASYTFFNHIPRSEIRGLFKFNDELQKFAYKTLRRARGNRKNVTFIGVHVRRTDMLKKFQYYNKRIAERSYFDKAFRHFEERYRDCLFIVCSDNIEWCKKNIKHESVFFQTKRVKPEYDLALLSHCNHSVIDYGTFGFWGAFLAGGETVYMGNSTAPGSWYDLENPEGKIFFLPEWTPITEITPSFWDTFPIVPKQRRKGVIWIGKDKSH